MKIKRIICLLLAALTLLTATGCAAVIEGEKLEVSRHVEETDGEKTEKRYIEVETYDQLYNAVYSIVRAHLEKGYIKASNYTGKIQSDVENVCLTIYNDDPVGAYALYYITGNVNRIVSYYEIEIDATYSHTVEQMNNIRTASSKRFFYYEILDAMTEYTDCCAVYTTVETVSADDVKEYVDEAYYSNPLSIVRKPTVSITSYPNDGAERIIEVKFDYMSPALTSKTMTADLQKSVRSIAGTVTEEADEYVALELTESLINCTEPDIVSAIPGNFSEKNITTTAYGALVNGKAVGEGYAMAYKAMCDEMNIECVVVTGRRNNVTHSWNIIKIGTSHYHVDNYVCDVNGMEAGFLLSDADMGDYWWDTLQYSECVGTLTYGKIAGIEPPPEPNGPEEVTSQP